LRRRLRIDEKQRSANFTEAGTEKLEACSQKPACCRRHALRRRNVSLVHHINQALRAHKLFQRDKDYIVNDESRHHRRVHRPHDAGPPLLRRPAPGARGQGRRGIQPENQTLASITFQNYFRLYDKLAGMTGTASTEAEEFGNIYKLEVVEIPTNVPVQRIDEDDEVYRTVEEKYDRRHHRPCRQGRSRRLAQAAVLVGTTSIEKSESRSSC
jgi:preprotein translocase subunit SecA